MDESQSKPLYYSNKTEPSTRPGLNLKNLLAAKAGFTQQNTTILTEQVVLETKLSPCGCGTWEENRHRVGRAGKFIDEKINSVESACIIAVA
jgi:hypothetical protein